ncbi:Adenylosuccinate synthase, partial [Coemansia spiralis]
VTSFPADLDDLETATVNYVTLPGWKQSIGKCRSFAELPENCQRYVRFIEQDIGVPIKWIGVGAGREEMITIE